MKIKLKFTNFLSTWQLIIRRAVTHWRLLSCVVLGVLLATSIMASTVIYFDSLRNLALDTILDEYPKSDINIILATEKGPTTRLQYGKVSNILTNEMKPLAAWMAERIERSGKSSVFAVASADQLNDPMKSWDGKTRANFIFTEGLKRDVRFKNGEMPKEIPMAVDKGPMLLEAIVPSSQAEMFGIDVGDSVALVPLRSGKHPYVLVTVSGLFDVIDSATGLNDLESKIFSRGTSINFEALQFYVTEEVYFDVLGSGFPKLDSIYAWHLDLDKDEIEANNAFDILVNLRILGNSLGSGLFAYEQITDLDKALVTFERKHFFTKLPMLVAMILIVVVILYYILTIASMVIGRQRDEIVLLRSRGASSIQIVTVFLLESATISFVGALLGPIIAGFTIALLGYTPAFSALTSGSMLPVDISLSSYGISFVGGFLTFLALGVPAIQASKIGTVRHRQELARPVLQPAFQRYYVDVVLLVIAVVIFRQLSEQGSVVATNVFGDRIVDQVLLAMPALVLTASAMVLLRLLPLFMSISSRVFSRRLPVGLVLGLWQMSRNPTHYARLSLLLILMSGLGIFVASVGGTLKLNYKERVLYDTGSDLRVEGISMDPLGHSVSFKTKYDDVKGINESAIAYRGRAYDLSRTPGRPIRVLGIETENLQDISWYRSDFSEKSLQETLGALDYPGLPPGIELPHNSKYLEVIIRTDKPYRSLQLVGRVRDKNGRHFSYSFGRLNSLDWTKMSTDLYGKGFSSATPWLTPVRPLSLVSIGISERDDRRQLEPGWFQVDQIGVRTDTGNEEILDSFDSKDKWNPLGNNAESVSDTFQYIEDSERSKGTTGLFAWTAGRPLTSRGIYAGLPLDPLPVLASSNFLKMSGHRVGDDFQVTVGGGRISVKVNASIDYFPTLDTVKDPWIIADIHSLISLSNLELTSGEIAVPNEVWVSTDFNFEDRDNLVFNLGTDPFLSDVVYDREKILASTEVDPLMDAGWLALLIISFVVVLSLSCIGFLLHSFVSLRDREGQFALLRSMGLSTNQLAALIWLEQTLVVIVGLILGSWMGRQVGSTIMTFMDHDDTGGRVLPPFTMDIEWTSLVITYVMIAIVFSLIISGVLWVVKRQSIQQVLRFGGM